MSAIKIIVNGDFVSLEYEEKTGKNIDIRLRQLKSTLGVTWYGVASALGMKPTEASVRLFKRWCRSPEMASHQEMPESQWKVLLMLTLGQDPAISD
ncbi:hypothetical protein [Vibrio fluvialis]|uniref:hypothetical protein n=1 Tax=Vibrio fluvialis TaxID=676 RepID=UPI003999740D